MRYAVALLLLTLTACTSLLEYERGAGRSEAVHVVQPGETLYEIAWRHDLDHRTLAQWNDLRNPDLIYAGQRIRLEPSRRGDRASSSAAASPRPPSQRSAAPPRTSPPPPVLPPPLWERPTNGPVVSRYGDGTAIPSGIGIGGRAGQTVNAAAAGRVVYTGRGLIGYGQLVIIKHNDTYLSAYGHLGDVVVVQGQDVRRGEKIAEMGLGPQRQPRLHFEIRRNGVPVDPLQLLGASS